MRHGEERSIDRLHHHLTLAVVHGHGTTCYVTKDNVFSDPNLTIEVLQRTLNDVESARGYLPNALYLQLDNCSRENKNSALFNWLGSLVERGLFPGGIEVGFLPVGHTHNEVDQVASRISIAVRHREIQTPIEMVQLLQESFSGMNVVDLDNVADSKEFLNPGGAASWVRSRWKRVQGSTDHFFFFISKDPLDNIVMATKASCEDLHWSRPY